MIRGAPKIFIDDTHLRKPTKVQVKSAIIPPSVAQKYNNGESGQQKAAAAAGTYLAKYQQPHAPIMPQFKPLVQVDPSLLTGNRTPLQNPRPGDYLLNKTASTEGIASKKSLELKKRYLLGEPANGNKIQKSGSTSVLDSRIRSFQSNISECQKLLNPSSDISATMKTFLDRTKLGEKANQQELMRSATNNIINDLKVEITIQKASSAASTDNEKENVFVNSKNELNKCMEYSETVNSTTPLLDSVINKISPTTPTNNRAIIETIDLVTPEKDESRDKSDSNKVIDLTGDSPEKSNRTLHENVTKPDVSRDVIQCIPDILGHIEENNDRSPCVATDTAPKQEEVNSYENNVEKSDSPEKTQIQNDTVEDVQIEVPNIEWNTHKSDNLSLSTNSSCSSHSSSLEDIEHYILESTTSPETNNSAVAVISSSSTGNHMVPRVEVHDSSGTLMQIDSLMIIDGKYIGDPEDLKYMELPEGIILPELPAIKTSELDDDHELDPDQDPVTSTPEPVEATVIEASTDKLDEEHGDDQPPPLPEIGPPLPEKGPPRVKPSNLKFDTRNENKIESLKNLPLIVDTTTVEHTKAVKPITLNISTAQKVAEIKVSQQQLKSPTSPSVDFDKTPTGDVLSRGSDSETEPTGTAQILTETELSDWTADDCISENFIDMDFVNKALKGKSHKRGKRTTVSPLFSTGNRLPSTDEVMQAVASTAPVAEFEGILKSIDLDDIEFMDTGSESSDTEPHSATNTALLRNKGYVEFVEQTTPKHAAPPADNIVESSKTRPVYESYKGVKMRRDEKLGIDYIEQGAYIMHDDANKTPVNEASHCIGTSQVTASSLMTQSLTDSSTINDIEDDSTNSQLQLSSAGTGDYFPPNSATVTTEESEALTVVSSPLDSSSPQTRNSIGGPKNDFVGRGATAADCASTPSSSDRAPKTSQSTTRSNSGTSSSKNTPPRQSSKDSNNIPLPGDRRSNDELSYEEYVRALQQKIVQISSTARGDSLDVKKQRRKSSKGEVPTSGAAFSNPNQTVIETTTPTNLRFDTNDDGTTALQLQMSTNNATTSTSSTQQQQLNKVPEIPTLTRKLEEITKERTKQKDLIHDLVMDKLQSKKQLNAEKRLHRSRQRSIITGGTSGVIMVGGGGYSSGSSLSPTPKLAAANSTTDANCTNQAHYHVSTAATATSPSARTAAATQRFLSNSSSFKENNPSSTYVSTYGAGTLSPTRANAYKQRPFSEHLESDQIAAALEHRYKINKTPSFSYTTGSQRISRQPVACPSTLSTPIPPTRHNRGRPAAVDGGPAQQESNKDTNISTSTENLRSEARARARLKSNSELGLSPEEKMQLLRKRIQTEHSGSSAKGNGKEGSTNTSYDRQTSIRESKMNASKSVNDLAYLANSQKHNVGHTDDSPSSTTSVVKSDFTSDPNILLSSTQSTSISSSKLIKTGRRPKDPERRKSLIQSLSNFFHKGQHCKEGRGKDVTTTSDGNSAQTEQPGTGSSGGGGGSSIQSTSQAISGIDGVLSRFRISPKSKEKSRDKEDNTADGSSTRRLRTSSACLALSYEPHKHLSQDALSPRSHLAHTPHSHSQLNSLNYNSNSISKSCKRNSSSQRSHLNHHTQQNNFPGLCSSNNSTKKSSSSSALAYSSSSPQLCAHKSQSMTNTSNVAAAYDDQIPPPIPPLPLNYQRSDDESYSAETRDQKKQRAISKAVRQAELKRLRIAQEIQREQEEIEVQLKELETRGVLIEKALRGEEPNLETTNNVGSNDEKLLKELLEIWRNITQLKKRDEELGIRQQELQLEHRHAQLKEELNMRLSCNKLDKSSADVAAEGAILNEMLEIVAKRAALRPSASTHDLVSAPELLRSGELASCSNKLQLSSSRGQSHDIEESNI